MATPKSKPKDSLKEEKKKTDSPNSSKRMSKDGGVLLDQIKKAELSSNKVKDDDDFNQDEILSVSDQVTIKLSVAESEDVLTMNIQEMESIFQEKFDLKMDTDLKDAILMDFYVTSAYWAQQHNYSARKLSAFFTVVCALMEQVIEGHATLVELMKEFHIMLSAIGTDVKVENDTLKIFNMTEGKEIVNFFSTSMFQHFKLYQFMYSRTQSEEKITSELTVELPLPADAPFPPILDEGMPEYLIKEYSANQTPSSVSHEDVEAKSTIVDDMELPADIEYIFAKLTPERVKSIINEVSIVVLGSLQAETEIKMKSQENNLLGKINKIQ